VVLFSTITNFIEQDLYTTIDELIRKTYFKNPENRTQKIITIFINKPLHFIKYITIFIFFRRWAAIETVIRLNKKFKKLREKGKAVTKGLKFVEGKDTEDIFTIEKVLNRKLGSFGMHYWYKSQFWQMFSNAIFFIYIINVFIFNSINVLSITTVIYLFIFFSGKVMSPMYVKMYLRQMSREQNALAQIEKTDESAPV
jgi:hypothetical protein